MTLTEAVTRRAAQTPPAGHRHIPDGAVLALACLGQFMVVLDVSVVNVALPSIRGDLDFSGTGLQWIVNAYTIAFAGFLLLGGRAADLLGQRRVFSAGLALFTLASLVGGFAETRGMLVSARAVQGLGAAIMSPATLTMLTTTFTGAARAKALGAWSAVAGGGGAAGSLVGGVLTDVAGWRWVLFVNVPIGVAGLLAARVILRGRDASATQTRGLDVLGALLVTGGLALLVFGIVSSDSHGWGSPVTWGPAVGGAVLLAAFVAFEARGAAVPLMPLRLFSSRGLSVANATMFFLAAAIFASWYFLSLYMQNVLHYSPLKTGFGFLPQTLAIVVSAQLSSRLVGRLGPRPLLVIGGACATVGLGWLSLIPVHGTYLGSLAVPCVLAGFGVGLGFTPIALSATAGVARDDAGLASGLVTTMRQVGGSLGLAVLATIAVDHTSTLTRTGTTAVRALVDGYDRAFEVSAGFAVISVLVCLLLPRVQASASGPVVLAE